MKIAEELVFFYVDLLLLRALDPERRCVGQSSNLMRHQLGVDVAPLHLMRPRPHQVAGFVYEWHLKRRNDPAHFRRMQHLTCRVRWNRFGLQLLLLCPKTSTCPKKEKGTKKRNEKRKKKEAVLNKEKPQQKEPTKAASFQHGYFPAPCAASQFSALVPARE